jgi:uracil-DNA glycosylase
MSDDYDPIAAGAHCPDCPLNKTVVVPPEGRSDARIVVVGEGPGREEIIRRRPFIGASGRLLEEMLDSAGVTRSQVWITNATLCRPFTPGVQGQKSHDLTTLLAWVRVQNKAARKAGKPLMLSPVDACRPRLLRELARLEQRALTLGLPNGLVVLSLGNHATHSLTGKMGVQKLRGSPVRCTVTDGQIAPHWDPRPEGV